METILLYDSHPIILRGIRGVLSGMTEKYRIFQTSDMEELSMLLEGGTIDVVFAGINEKSYLDTRMIKKHSKIQWMVLYNDDLYKKALTYFLAGARGLISKSSDARETLSCFDAVVRGNTYICERTIHSLAHDLLFDHSCKNLLRFFLRAKPNQWKRGLTDREKQVATLLLRGFRTTEIAQKLNLKLTTISTLKRAVLNKNNVNTVVELVSMF